MDVSAEIGRYERGEFLDGAGTFVVGTHQHQAAGGLCRGDDERSGAINAESADDDGRGIQRSEQWSDGADAFFIVRAVDNEATPVEEAEFLPAAGPLDGAQRSAGLGVIDGQTRRQLAREQSRAGVATLVRTDEVRFREAGGKTIADEMERRANLTGTGDDDRFGFGRNIADNARHAGLNNAPFSAAMVASVGPRYSWWSRPMDVITQTSGAQTLVASSRPPRPVSRIAISTWRSANSNSAAAVISSKNVGAFSGSSARMAS